MNDLRDIFDVFIRASVEASAADARREEIARQRPAMKPTYPLWDKRFEYTNAANTTTDYLRARFREIRAQLDAEKRASKGVLPIAWKYT